MCVHVYIQYNYYNYIIIDNMYIHVYTCTCTYTCIQLYIVLSAVIVFPNHTYDECFALSTLNVSIKQS